MRPREKTPCQMFAETLRRLRKKRELTQEELGYLTEMHHTEISALERAKREPRLGTLLKLSAVLEAPPREFFVGIEWAPILPSTAPPSGRFYVGLVATSTAGPFLKAGVMLT